MQHPVMQISPGWQAGRQGVPHGEKPVGQTGVLHPPCSQSAGRVRFPTQSSQASQEFRHPATWVQGLQRVGSATCARSQLGSPDASREPIQIAVGAPGTWQQPKQSQPLGVSGPQVVVHCVLWDSDRVAQSPGPPTRTTVVVGS